MKSRGNYREISRDLKSHQGGIQGDLGDLGKSRRFQGDLKRTKGI